MSCSNLNFCSGCLSSERKMQLLNKYWNKQCFMGILNEISMPQIGMNPVWLCWECEALLTRFTKFKHQVRHSYKMLHEYAKENLNLLGSQKKSKLKTQKQFHLTINPIESNCVFNVILEYEQSKEYLADKTRVKSETDALDNDCLAIGCELEEKLENNTAELLTDKTNVKSELDDISLKSDDDSELLIEIRTLAVDESKELTLTDGKEVKSEIKDVSDTVNCSRRKNKKNSKIKGMKKKKRKVGNFKMYKEIELSKEELEEERRVLLSSEDYTNAMFKCDKCILSFPNQDDLKDHIYGKHEQITKYRCPVCECYLPTEASLNYHAGRHATRFQCRTCGHRSGTRAAATRHYHTEHCHSADIDQGVQEDLIENGDEAPVASENGEKSAAPASFPCASCDQTFPCRASLGEHAATHGGAAAGAAAAAGARHQCASCDKTFRWRTSLRKHAEMHRIAAGDQRRPYCEVCRQSFTATYNLQKHLKSSAKHQIQLKLRKLGEPQPGAAPDTQLQARIDVIKSAVMASRQLHACAQCGRRFQWRGNLARHLQSHRARANGELVCAPCDRTFSSIATFNQHMRNSKRHVDESEFRYMCSDCGKRFPNKPQLRDHIDWDHLKNYVHSCATCQKVFKCHTSLYLHKQMVHGKDRANHLCDHCGKHFPSRSKLRCHMTAVHSGSTPYRCAQCDARFNWASCLSRHVKRLHKGKEAAAGAAGGEKQ